MDAVIALSRLRRADSWLGWPVAILLGLWPRRRRPVPASPRAIVVVKLSGLGSLLTCAAVFRALRAAQPQARITVVALEGTAPAAQLLPEVDEVIAISAASPVRLLRNGLRALRTLRSRRVDVIADIEYFSKLSTVFCALAGARCRLGFQLPARWRTRLLDGGVAFREDIHFRACVAQLLQPLGVDGRNLADAAVLPCPIRIPPAAGPAADELLAACGGSVDTCWIAVNPHATALCVQRRWPLERFAQVAGALLQAHPARRLLIPGSADERARAEDLRVQLPASVRERVHVLAGRTDLATLAAVLRACRLVLTGDTGLMHVAAAAGTPLVALFGPESPVRYGPVGSGPVRVLCGVVPCGPCLCYKNHKRAPCGAEPAACMLAIDTGDVLRACEELLAEERKET